VSSLKVKKNQLKKIVYICCFLLLLHYSYATDSLTVWTNSQYYKQGDTMQVEVALQKLTTENNMQSIFVVVQNVETRKKWEFRYPLINGSLIIEYVIGSQLQSGNYALSFLLNPQFYTINATVKQGLKKEKKIKYTLLTKNNNGLVDDVMLNENNKFSLKNLVYPDTAFVVFALKKQQKRNDLDISIATPLDSVFKPTYSTTTFLNINNADTATFNALLQLKQYDYESSLYKNSGELVTVYGVKNNKVQKFEKDNVSALFKSIDEIVIDGLSSKDITVSGDLYSFLTTKIPGLSTSIDALNGITNLVYRKQKVVIYLNELKIADDDFLSINIDDIALIKFLKNNSLLTNSSTAALAIYTKGVNDYVQPQNKYSFKIMGYSPQLSILN
jgi:hypothetical protein